MQFVGNHFTWADNPAGASQVESMAIVWLYADPPDELESPDRGPWPGGVSPYPYMVVTRVVVTSAALATQLNDFGLPTLVGTVDASFVGTVGTLSVDDGEAAWTLTTSAAGEGAEEGPEGLRFFGASGGVLSGTVDFDEGLHSHTPPPGAADFTLDSGTPVFRASGARPSRSTARAGTCRR